METQEQSHNPFEEFSPEVKEAVDGLIYLGHLEDQFEFCGHTFNIRTLKIGEELLASQVAKEYADTLGFNRAWMSAQVAMSLVAVDFDEDFCPKAGPDPKAYARARFNFVTQNWYAPTAEFIFGKYSQLLQKQVMAIDAIENLSQGNLWPFSPSPDSLKSKGTSPEKTDGEDQT